MQEAHSTYNLFEFQSLEDIVLPIRNTSRVKYTCFDVSKNFIILGANSGSLYIFCRNTLHHLKVIPHKEGPVTLVTISPNEQYVAFSTSKGTVITLEHNVDNGSHVRSGRQGLSTSSPRYLQRTNEHQERTVTALHWSITSSRLFIGDDNGTVTSLNVVAKKTQVLFQTPSSTIVRLNAKIVQLDFFNDKLLISTMTSCYLCDTVKEVYSQIGSKPRDGDFGACFSTSTNQTSAIIYAARPGKRLWEVDFDGNVLCTHQLKNALLQAQTPHVSVIEPFRGDSVKMQGNPQTLNFSKLQIIGEHFWLTWVHDKLIIFNTKSMELLLWTELAEDILDVRICARTVYTYHKCQLRSFRLLEVEKGIHRLLLDNRWELCARTCVFYTSSILPAKVRTLLPKCALQVLENRLHEECKEDLAKKIAEIIPRLEEASDAIKGASSTTVDGATGSYRLSSGIYVVNRPISNLKNVQLSTGQFQKFHGEVGGELTDVRGREKQMSNGFVPKEGEVNRVMQLGQMCSTADPIYSNYSDMSMFMPYLNTSSWDVDAYSALSTLRPTVSFEEIKNSLSSTYQSGKKRILDTVGILEDRLKLSNAEGYAEPLDIQCNRTDREYAKETTDFDEQIEEAIIFPKTTEQGHCEEFAFSKHCIAPYVPVDVERLLGATEETWKILQKPSEINGIDGIKDILEKWVDVLNFTQELWYNKLHANAKQPGEESRASNETEMTLKQSKSCTSLSSKHQNSEESFKRSLGSCPSLNEFPDVATECSTSDHATFKSLEDSCDCHSQCRLDSALSEPTIAEESSSACHFTSDVTLEDVLWWQDATLRTKPATSSDARDYEQKCWLCEPSFICGNGWKLNSGAEKIRRLCLMCLKAGTYGRITTYCQSYSCWTTFQTLEDDDDDDNFVSELDNLSEFVISKTDLVLDHARSIFIRQYFGYLKPETAFDVIRQDRSWGCRSWQTVLDGIQFLNSQSSKSASDLSQPINLFLSLRRNRTEENAQIIIERLHNNRIVTARDVLYLDRVLKSGGHLFLTYMDKICSDDDELRAETDCQVSSRSTHERVDATNDDGVVRDACIQLMLQDGPRPEESCVLCATCGKPRPFSHLFPWKWKDRLVTTLKKDRENYDAFIDMCLKWRFWIGLIHLHHKRGSRNEMFQLVIQLGDIDLFRDPANIGLLPQTTSEWEFVLEVLIGHQENGSLHCAKCWSDPYVVHSQPSDVPISPKRVSLEDISYLMMYYCEASVALALLTKVLGAHPTLRFSSKFYLFCMHAIIIKQHQRALAYNVLEKTDAYVWSKRKNYASPEIRSSLLSDEEDVEVNLEMCRFVEDLHCHWGINFNFRSQCFICLHPLVLSSSAKLSGILVFPCGHGYHKSCLVRECCPKCQRSTAGSSSNNSK